MSTVGPNAAPFLRRRDPLDAWLPRGEDLFAPWRRHRAADGPLSFDEMFAIPRDATRFVGGEAELSRIAAVYDSAHHIALYGQGCCAWQETVLAFVSTPPPRAVAAANLGALRSRRGIRLGASPSAVRRAYGPAGLYRSTTTRGLRVLSYYRDQHLKGSYCGWFENFVFRAYRLVEIQAGHSC